MVTGNAATTTKTSNSSHSAFPTEQSKIIYRAMKLCDDFLYYI